MPIRIPRDEVHNSGLDEENRSSGLAILSFSNRLYVRSLEVNIRALSEPTLNRNMIIYVVDWVARFQPFSPETMTNAADFQAD